MALAVIGLQGRINVSTLLDLDLYLLADAEGARFCQRLAFCLFAYDVASAA
jgi:hypothetical protein